MTNRPAHVARAHFAARRLRILACLAALALGPAAIDASQEPPSIDVTEAGGVYTVAASFTIPHAPPFAMAALTDYPAIPRFMPDVRTSVVLERRADRVVVQQEATARFLMFSKRVHLVLEVEERGGTIRFRDRCGKSFSRYEGHWTVIRTADGARVTYGLIAEPAFDVPDFLLKRLLKRDATRMIDALKTEISSRARASTPSRRDNDR